MKRTFHEGGVTLTLHKHPTHYELMIGDVPILTSKVLGTERDFGKLAGALKTRENARILIGGLGFGSTLLGALEVLGPEAEIIVVERLKTVVRLMKGELEGLAGGALADPRVKIVRGDVAVEIARARDLDVILLDVDNGPEWASFHDNAGLYNREGLAAARAALRTGGSYAVWSGYPVDGFLGELSAAGFAPSTIELREGGQIGMTRGIPDSRDIERHAGDREHQGRSFDEHGSDGDDPVIESTDRKDAA